MVEDIYDPLDEYVHVFRDRFKQVAKDTFAQLAEEAKVDVEANRETCRQIYETEESIDSLTSDISRTTFCCVALWALVVMEGVAVYVLYDGLSTWQVILLVLLLALLVTLLLTVFHPRLRKQKDERDDLEQTADDFRNEAWRQMEPLNRLYDWDVLTRMMTKTVPRLEFDPYFTTQRLADLQHVYGWDGTFNRERSVIYSHSGLINGNPFVLCRTRKMEMGAKTYYGHLTIYWTTEERDSDGKYHTVHHSETLTAEVAAPYPEYYEKTRLFYGNTAAPDLIFYRRKSGMADKEGSLSYWWKRRRLKSKSRDLSNLDFAMMTNEEFEVAFDTSNRNNNQQFALLFTPLAQKNMLKLLKDYEAGYGDDFDFDKNRMINTIISDHIQSFDLDMNPDQYRQFDYAKAERDFFEINVRHFRAIYFCLAPLLCVPMYQQIRPLQAIYGKDMPRHSAFWEHEALANFWGQDHFKHPGCVTDCILKTHEDRGADGKSTITVYAHGYRAEERVSFVSKWGGDGHMHNVPVYWDEYIPVTGQGSLRMAEDNTPTNLDAPPSQRIHHINDVLGKTGMSVYRRHIASKL